MSQCWNIRYVLINVKNFKLFLFSGRIPVLINGGTYIYTQTYEQTTKGRIYLHTLVKMIITFTRGREGDYDPYLEKVIIPVLSNPLKIFYKVLIF